MRPFRAPLGFLAALLIVLAACAHYPLNRALDPVPAAPSYEFPREANGTNTNGLFVCLVFSGGGTRAAALSYGVLERLRATPILWEGRDKSLLDEVDCISSVSGGSFTSAYYGLFPDKTFTDFRAGFLETDVEGALMTRVLSPSNWFRLASPTFSRIDLAAEYYGESLFAGKTFRDLGAGGRRPFIILNATNMATGERFEFTQPEFNVLGSDLGPYPVARAVAASSAFPFLLSPVSLKNHPAPPEVKFSREMRLAEGDFYDNRRRYQWAVNRTRYGDAVAYPYLHLMDGGLADNIGLRPIEDAFRRGFIRSLMNGGEIQKLVFIIVNARTEGQDGISRQEKAPGLKSVAMKTATVAMDNYSFDTIELIKELRDQRRQTQGVLRAFREKCPGAGAQPRLASEVEPFVVNIDFAAIKDPERRRYFLGLPTSFKLSREQVEKLISVGGELLAADPEFQELMGQIGKPGR
ncbi:MAG: patatin-like phospholipase family protein [Acidobacteria bacterium]|nr:patatin-like phospholipase family protein [Acidobacteriota bacterium]